MMNLKLNMQVFYMIKKLFLASIFFTFFIVSSDSQELSEEFLSSLPEDIKNDVLLSVKQGSNKVSQSKEYDAFSTSIKKDLDNSLATIKRFGDEFFTNMPSTCLPNL